MSQSLSSQRARLRTLKQRRRREKSERRRLWLEAIGRGVTYAQVADAARVSEITVRREVAHALAERGPESVETFVALQRARLDRALNCTAEMMNNEDPRAVAAFLALLPQVERYWGLQRALAAKNEKPQELQISAPTPLKSLEAGMNLPPLSAVPASEIAS